MDGGKPTGQHLRYEQDFLPNVELINYDDSFM